MLPVDVRRHCGHSTTIDTQRAGHHPSLLLSTALAPPLATITPLPLPLPRLVNREPSTQSSCYNRFNEQQGPIAIRTAAASQSSRQAPACGSSTTSEWSRWGPWCGRHWIHRRRDKTQRPSDIAVRMASNYIGCRRGDCARVGVRSGGW